MHPSLYITGAGVSAESGIPTFRGEDGFWTIGSANYTPQQMATRAMYMQRPAEFLLWYYRRFAQYRHLEPNRVHRWLADKKLITQNIDGLDGKAGNVDYIPIHGRLDKVTVLHDQGAEVELLDAPWQQVADNQDAANDDGHLKTALLDAFRISSTTQTPQMNQSLKPFVLLFDEYYTELYRMSVAQNWLLSATKMVFIGTSFSVGITDIALQCALQNNAPVHIVDPDPADLGVDGIHYHRMSAAEFIATQ